MHGTKVRVVVVNAPGIFVHVQLAGEDYPGIAQLGGNGGVVLGHKVLVNLGGHGGDLVRKVDIVFQRQGHTMEHALVLAGHDVLFGLFGTFSGLLGGDGNVGVGLWVRLVDVGQ